MTHEISMAARALLALALVGACRGEHATTPVARAPAIDVEELSLADAEARLASGALTARALTQAYLDRIAAIDVAGPALHAVIELNPRALADADTLDAERAAGKIRGPLHGVPVLLKDNIDAVGMACTAGSLALVDLHPDHDAFLVARLRAAGAIILGKTNLSEWANFRSTHSISGWSSRGGQTRNPYALDRNPCGSSSGTGAGIAASLAVVGVGTETDGSIICPSSINGLVGLKPTVGLVSRSGIIPIAISQDTAGPMGRTVADVAALLGVIAGVDDRDPAGAAATGKIAADYRAALRPDALKGARLGVYRQTMGNLPSVDAATELAIAALRDAGAEVVDVTIPTHGKWGDAELVVLQYEFKAGLDTYLQAGGATPGSLEALITWDLANAARAMPLFAQEMFVQSQARGPLTDDVYLKARDDARRLAGAEGLLAALDHDHLDAIIAPASPPAWVTDPVLGDHFVDEGGSSIAAVAGAPAITVPMAEVHGLPVGLVFMGRPYSEAALLGYAYGFEQATHARTKPTYRATVGP